MVLESSGLAGEKREGLASMACLLRVNLYEDALQWNSGSTWYLVLWYTSELCCFYFKYILQDYLHRIKCISAF